jgi:hypothetical protein
MIKKSTTWWSTGITIRYLPDAIERHGRSYDGWSATAKFYDSGFVSDDTDTGSISTQGELGTRYFIRDGETVDGLTAAIDVILADAKKIDIQWGQGCPPTLYYEGDGEDPEWPPPPNWKRIIRDQCTRLGWDCLYTDDNTIDGEVVPDRAQIEVGRDGNPTTICVQWFDYDAPCRPTPGTPKSTPRRPCSR